MQLLAVAACAALIGTLLLDRVSEATFRSSTRRVVLVLGGVYVAQGLWAAWGS